MYRVLKIVTFVFVFVLFFSCGTKKDTAISRNYQALTTKFNVLFNGKEYLRKGIETIDAQYEDDFWQLLPIEPIEFEEERVTISDIVPNERISVPGSDFGNENSEEKQATNFEKAEEKAVKAIQRHSMNIDGRERNRQIDDAYLLLGKARYYSQRFVPAIEAFNYVIANYPYANLISETKIWRAKSNIRIENEELAVESLKLLLRDETLSDEIKEQAHTALAMAYTKLDSTHRVIEHLKLATKTDENKGQTARNMFILGQMYSLENQRDSAVMIFEKLAAFRKAPYKYRIYANIEVVKNTSKDSSTLALLERFDKLIKNRDNRPYLDALYYQVGVLHENQDSTMLAIDYYNRSLRSKNGTGKQKTFSYEKLGNIYFKDTKYILASNYYDSVLKVARDSNNLRIRRIKRRHKSLEALISYEKTIKTNDSILKLAALSKEEQVQFFEDYVAKIKLEDEKLAQQQLNTISFGNEFGSGLQQTDNKGKWYFYNTQSLGFGKAAFERVWGNRPLEDNWRWSDKTTIAAGNDKTDTTSVKSQRYDVESYVKRIPTTKTAIDSLHTGRNEALFELGLIYKEQFENKNRSADYLERLLVSKPDSTLVLPANYHLYRLYEENNNSKANKYKNFILENYAETRFAQIIEFPEKELKEEKRVVSETEKLYKQFYYLYKEDKYEDVVCLIDMTLPTLKNSNFIPKFELLKAYAIGKYQDKKAYKTALEYIAVQYPTQEEGKMAKEILTRLK